MAHLGAVVPTLAMLLAGATVTGCVERKMVIRSTPAASRVFVDGQEVEGAPTAGGVEVPFDWGGTRQVTVMAPGYKVLDQNVEVEDPWYTRFPFDLVTDFANPFTIEDRQEFDLALEPYHPMNQSFSAAQEAEIEERLLGLMARAEAHRKGGLAGPDQDVLRRARERAVRPAPGAQAGVPPRMDGSSAPPVRMEGDIPPPVRFGTDVEEPPPPPPAPIRDKR